MVASDLEIERDDLYSRERAFNKFTSAIAVSLVGKLHANQQLGSCQRADRDICVVREHIASIGLSALERDQRAGVENQSLHASFIGALPTNRRRSATSLSQASSGGWARRNSRNAPRVVRRAGATVAIARPRRTTVNVSPRCSTASSMSANRFDASVAEISAMIGLSEIDPTQVNARSRTAGLES